MSALPIIEAEFTTYRIVHPPSFRQWIPWFLIGPHPHTPQAQKDFRTTYKSHAVTAWHKVPIQEVGPITWLNCTVRTQWGISNSKLFMCLINLSKDTFFTCTILLHSRAAAKKREHLQALMLLSRSIQSGGRSGQSNDGEHSQIMRYVQFRSLQ